MKPLYAFLVLFLFSCNSSSESQGQKIEPNNKNSPFPELQYTAVYYSSLVAERIPELDSNPIANAVRAEADSFVNTRNLVIGRGTLLWENMLCIKKDALTQTAMSPTNNAEALAIYQRDYGMTFSQEYSFQPSQDQYQFSNQKVVHGNITGKASFSATNNAGIAEKINFDFSGGIYSNVVKMQRVGLPSFSLNNPPRPLVYWGFVVTFDNAEVDGLHHKKLYDLCVKQEQN